MKKVKKSQSQILTEVKEKEYNFDDAALKYASMTEEEAKQHVAELKRKVKEIEGDANLSSNPSKIHELRELKSSLAWFRLNKHRSKYFKILPVTPSMRKAKRHPDPQIFKGSNANTSSRRKSKKRHKRKTVQTSKSLFSRIFGGKSEE